MTLVCLVTRGAPRHELRCQHERAAQPRSARAALDSPNVNGDRVDGAGVRAEPDDSLQLAELLRLQIADCHNRSA